MWQRRTFHECVSELMVFSERFRAEWKSHYRHDMSLAARSPILSEASARGVEVLRVLALAVRSDQDYGLMPRDTTAVGAVNENATDKDVTHLIASYVPPYTGLSGFSHLNLRQGLNKVAHADPARAGFYADANHHDLILSGTKAKKTWVAVLSIIDLCAVIEALPDYRLHAE